MNNPNTILPERYAILDPPDLWISLAKHILKCIEDNVTQSKVFHLALSGGATPINFFRWISTQTELNFDWHDVHLWWCDERSVPISDVRSNFGTALDELINPLRLSLEQVHPMPAYPDLKKGAESYADELCHFLPVSDNLPVFDLIWLGVGEDGHTASLFPMAPTLNEDSIVVSEPRAPDGTGRLSLSLPVLMSARKIVAVVLGKSKQAVLSKIFSDRNSDLPAARMIAGRPDIYWFFNSESFPLGF